MFRAQAIAALVVFACATSADARPIDGTDLFEGSAQKAEPPPPSGLVGYNKIFLNRCAAGCTVKVGSSNSLADSWPINAQSTLTAFPYGDAAWQKVLACVQDVFSVYNVQVTDVDPGTTTNHFEIMIAGSPTDLGMPSQYGGVAPPGCHAPYLNNALVFDFAKAWGIGGTCSDGCIEEICDTAAQEIGHTWGDLDHTIDNRDPMTYYAYSKRKYFKDADDQCGSDCVNGTGPLGVTCTGTNLQSHVCRCTSGKQTQNSHDVIQGLFGINAGTPPTVTFTAPHAGQTVDKGFQITVTATDDSGYVDNVALKIDGTVVATLTDMPYTFTAPATLADGMHHLEVTALDPPQTPGSAALDVVINPPCKVSTDCPNATDACVADRCVPGPNEPGGLGATCVNQVDCLSNQCASDGSSMHCVESCMQGQCPSGFGCLDDGTGNGYCWPGFDDSSGGCGCESNRPGGPLTLGLLFAVGLFSCRRRRR